MAGIGFVDPVLYGLVVCCLGVSVIRVLVLSVLGLSLPSCVLSWGAGCCLFDESSLVEVSYPVCSLDVLMSLLYADVCRWKHCFLSLVSFSPFLLFELRSLCTVCWYFSLLLLLLYICTWCLSVLPMLRVVTCHLFRIEFCVCVLYVLVHYTVCCLVLTACVCVGVSSLLVLWVGGTLSEYIGVVYCCSVVWGVSRWSYWGFNRVSKILFGAMVCSSFKWLSFLNSV